MWNHRKIREPKGCGSTTTYVYDNNYRLISASYPWGDTVEYEYDAVGNRLAMIVNGEIECTYTYDAENRLFGINDGTTYEYDHNGNLIKKTKNGNTTTYKYDYKNRLIGIMLPDGTSIEYSYCEGCEDNKRVAKIITYPNGTTEITRYSYDNEDIIIEWDGSGQVTARYVHGPGIDEPIAMYRLSLIHI